jgi:hypothetical protein
MHLSPRGGAFGNSFRKSGDSVMRIRGNNAPLPAELSNEEVVAARHRQQDDNFCRALRAALYARKESCAIGVSTEPGTKNPIINFRLRD